VLGKKACRLFHANQATDSVLDLLLAQREKTADCVKALSRFLTRAELNSFAARRVITWDEFEPLSPNDFVNRLQTCFYPWWAFG
jgi:hypothetical protein